MKLSEFLSDRGVAENGFDTIRLIAAALVLVSHAYVLTTGSPEAEPLYAFSNGQVKLGFLSVGCFFALSGLLITQSFQRSSSLGSYVRKRAARILPGLWMAVLVMIAALAFVTTLPLIDYLRHGQTLQFAIGNAIVLQPIYLLPGVFKDLPIEGVNGSLWTLRHELFCYAIVVLCGLAGARFGWAAAALTALSFALVSFEVPMPEVVATLADLFRFFGLGILFYHYRAHVPINWGLTALAGICLVALMPTLVTTHLVPLFVSYFVIGLGLLAPRWFGAPTRWGDISYGVYIYAFPVQQLLIPASLATPYPGAANILLASPIVVVLAVLSWLYVERPARDWNQRLRFGRKRAAPLAPAIEAEPR